MVSGFKEYLISFVDHLMGFLKLWGTGEYDIPKVHVANLWWQRSQGMVGGCGLPNTVFFTSK
jgi:hypothetical protein